MSKRTKFVYIETMFIKNKLWKSKALDNNKNFSGIKYFDIFEIPEI